MSEISEAAKKAAKRLGYRCGWREINPDNAEQVIQQSINEATAEKDDEIEQLRKEISRLNGKTMFYCPCGSGGYVKDSQVMAEACLDDVKAALEIIGIDTDITPPMFYKEAILKKFYEIKKSNH